MYKQLDQERKATDHRIDVGVTIIQKIWLKNGTAGKVQYLYWSQDLSSRTSSQRGIIKLFWWKLMCTVKVSMSYLCTIPIRLTTETFLLTLCTIPTILCLPHLNYGFTLSSGNFATEGTLYFCYFFREKLSYIFPVWKCEDPTNFWLVGRGIKGSFECKGFLNRVIGKFWNLLTSLIQKFYNDACNGW